MLADVDPLPMPTAYCNTDPILREMLNVPISTSGAIVCDAQRSKRFIGLATIADLVIETSAPESRNVWASTTSHARLRDDIRYCSISGFGQTDQGECGPSLRTIPQVY